MAMQDEYDPFDVGGVNPATGESTYVSTGGPGRGTAASQLGYTSDQVYGGGGGDGDDNNRFIARPGAGLTKAQFEKTYGITDRNPFGRRPSGFAAFLDKFSRSLGGKGVDYSQQFRDLDRLHNRRPGTSAARFRQRQYDLYRNPDITADGRIRSGGIDRAGRGTYQGPVEMVTREMGPGEQLVRAGIGSVPFAGSFLSGIGTEDPYLSSKVTDEMRARENQSLAEQLIGGLNLGDTIESIANKGSSMIERLQGLASGNQQPAQAPVASRPAMGSIDPSREIGPLAQTIPVGLTNQDEVAAMAMMPAEMLPAEMLPAEGMPAESDSRLSDNTTAEMLRESRVVDVPTPIGRRFDSPVTEIDTVTSRPMDEIDTISFQSLFPSEELDSIAAKPPELVNAPNVGLSRQDFPRNAPNVGLSRQDFLELFAPEPELGPYEQSQAPTRDLRDSTALAGLDYPTLSELMEMATSGGPRASTKVFGGDLEFTLDPDNPRIEFRRPLQGKDMGAGEFLSFLNRITS